MKQPTIRFAGYILFSILLLTVQLSALAQDNIKVTEAEVSSWFSRNWMWVVAGVILLLLIVIFSRGGSRRKTTTVVKDQYGDVRSVTTTEVKD